mgnify:FL=1
MSSNEDSDFEMASIDEGVEAAPIQPSLVYSIKPVQDSSPELTSWSDEDSVKEKRFKTELSNSTFRLEKVISTRADRRPMKGLRFSAAKRPQTNGPYPCPEMPPPKHVNTFYEPKKNPKRIHKASKKELQECTFNPLTNNPGLVRSFQKFLEDQARYENLKKKKLNLLLQEKECFPKQTFMCQGSCKIIKSKGTLQVPVHEKLFSQRFSKKQVETNTDNLFSPKLSPRSENLVRHKSASLILYEDALRRSKKSVSPQSIQSPRLMNEYSEKIITEKFNKQFNEVCEQLSSGDSDKLDFRKFCLLLFKLDFIKANRKSSNYFLEDDKVKSAWKILGGIENDYVKKDQVRIFLMIVLNYLEASNSLDPKKQKEIREYYKIFYENKVLGAITKKNTEVETPFKFSFKPEISKATEQFAFKKRKSRSLKFLVNEKLQFMQNWEHKRLEKEQKELEKCTFSPKINPSPKINSNYSQEHSELQDPPSFHEKPRVAEMLEKLKKAREKKAELRHKEETSVELEVSDSELSFSSLEEVAPRIKPSKNNKNSYLETIKHFLEKNPIESEGALKLKNIIMNS